MYSQENPCQRDMMMMMIANNLHYKYIIFVFPIYVTLLPLMATGVRSHGTEDYFTFSLSVANSKTTLFQWIPPTVGRGSGWIFISVDLSNTAWAERELINILLGNTFGAVIRIKPIIIVTFRTTNAVVHNGITFGVGIRDSNIVTVVPCWNK